MKLDDFLGLSLEEMKQYLEKMSPSNATQTKTSMEWMQKDFFFQEKDVFVQECLNQLEANTGWSWDRVELARMYFLHHKIEHVVLYEEYQDQENDLFFAQSFIIYFDTMYYELGEEKIGYENERQAIKKTYNRFIESLRNGIADFDYTCLFLGRYPYPEEMFSRKVSLSTWIKEKHLQNQTTALSYETSCMALVCCRVLNEIKVLTIENDNNQIDFPKGHPEHDETPIQTAIRECFEETQVKLEKEDFFRELPSYSYQFNAAILRMENSDFYQFFKAKMVFKTIKVLSFLVTQMQEPHPLSEERLIHSHWYPIDELEHILSYENARELIRTFRALLQ